MPKAKGGSAAAMLGKRDRQANPQNQINPPAEEAQQAPAKRTKIPKGMSRIYQKSAHIVAAQKFQTYFYNL